MCCRRRPLVREHLAVNVAAMCWGEWARFKRLGWSGPSQKLKAKIGVD